MNYGKLILILSTNFFNLQTINIKAVKIIYWEDAKSTKQLCKCNSVPHSREKKKL